MKKLFAIALALSMLVSLIPAAVALAEPGQETGNGSLSGPHYNLNIIGVPREKNWDADSGGEGSRIFVLRTGTTQFYVYGDDETSYAVLDHDGTDGKVGSGVGEAGAGITFPYDETTDTWQVEIYVRLLGPMDPTSNIVHWKTYYDYDGSAWLQVKTFDITRGKPSKFSLKTGDLLVDGYQDILWEMTPGDKFRILQMRIYLTDV
jgi:hypothetical protein